MAQTPLTSATAYADADDMIVRYDVRTLGDLLSDDDTRLTASQVSSSTKLAALLLAASGDIESAVVYGKKYLPTDLAAFTGACLELLIDLTCRLTMVKILGRRPTSFRLEEGSPEKMALDHLQLIRQGDRFFPTDEAGEAGKDVTRANLSPTTYQLTVQGQRYFGILSPPQT